MRHAGLVLLTAILSLAAFSCGESPATLEDLQARTITLPGGQEISAEVMLRPVDMMRGMMFRDSLAPNRGMLFIHDKPGTYGYWMYQVRIPLDMIWMDRTKTIVEISANTPPCPSKSARECPTYGGTKSAQYVLELAGGMAARYGLKVGDTLRFF